MFPELIERARQRAHQRIDKAFIAYSGGEQTSVDKSADRRLILDIANSQPIQENIRLPFPDEAVDWVACHELIETCISFERQVRLLRELLRIARKGIFVSTTNRWHPLSNWLRPPPHAGLLDEMKIKTMMNVLPGHLPWQLGHVRILGIKSHYFLMVWKHESYRTLSVDHRSQQPGIIKPSLSRNSAGDERKKMIQRSP